MQNTGPYFLVYEHEAECCKMVLAGTDVQYQQRKAVQGGPSSILTLRFNLICAVKEARPTRRLAISDSEEELKKLFEWRTRRQRHFCSTPLHRFRFALAGCNSWAWLPLPFNALQIDFEGKSAGVPFFFTRAGRRTWQAHSCAGLEEHGAS